jgi:hypothetical protein
MARDYARIKTSIWTDDDFIALPSGPQRTYHLILEQPELSLCGVLQPAYKRWAGFAPDTTMEDIEKDVFQLADATFVVIDDATDELLARSFVRHDIALSSENALVGVSRAFETIHSKVLRKVLIEELRKADDQSLLDRVTRHIPDGDKKPLRDRLSKPFVLAWEGAS